MFKIPDSIMQIIEPIIELAIYVALGFGISKMVSISFMEAMLIVFTYFIINVTRMLLSKKK